MKAEDSEKVVIAKPVASRPTCSNFRSFTELLTGAIDSAPPSHDVTPVAAIRPKTVRFKPPPSVSPSSSSSKAEFAGANVVHKPLAKVLSKTNFSFSTNLGGFNVDTQIETPINQNQEWQSESERGKVDSQSKWKQLTMDEGEGERSTNHFDRPSQDGYNWRKYGQKHVKGSEFPRSYYRCTHPNCPVKKKVERSSEGSVTEFVYKGEHNHSRPMLQNGNSSEPGLVDGNNKKRTEGWLQNLYQGDQIGLDTLDSSCGLGVDCEEPDSQDNPRRKTECFELSKGVAIVQNSTDPDVAGDGFRWRKYGQKTVKRSSYPRSYYRCTDANCNMRKYVERSSDDPTAFITTYEGKHSHDAPSKSSKALKTTTADNE